METKLRNQFVAKLDYVSKLLVDHRFTVIQLGQDPASTVYVNHKIKDCHRVNFHSEVHRLSENVTKIVS